MGVVCASGGQCLNAGYLTTKTTLDALEGRYVLRIPNKEIKREFQSLTAYYFHTDESSVAVLLEDLLQGNLEKFALRYQRKLLSGPLARSAYITFRYANAFRKQL